VGQLGEELVRAAVRFGPGVFAPTNLGFDIPLLGRALDPARRRLVDIGGQCVGDRLPQPLGIVLPFDDALLGAALSGVGRRGPGARVHQHDHRAGQVAVRVGQFGQYRRPVGVRERVVEQNGIGTDGATGGKSFGSGRRLHEPVAVVGVGRQLAAEGTPLGRVVIDNQDEAVRARHDQSSPGCGREAVRSLYRPKGWVVRRVRSLQSDSPALWLRGRTGKVAGSTIGTPLGTAARHCGQSLSQ
jgi:hypothetical protein